MFRNDESRRSGVDTRAPRARARFLLPVIALAWMSAFGAFTATSLRTAHADGVASAPVVVGEVSTSVGRDEVVPVLKKSLEGEIAKLVTPGGKKFVVSANLTKLETKTSGKDSTTSCVISIAVRDASGSLRGMTNGNSTIVTKLNDPSAEKSVLDAAVRGATKLLPEVLAKSS